jgi:hypothetical protein
MTLKCMPDDRLAHCAWVADVDLMMLAGCRTCWTYQLLLTMSLLGVLSRNSWDHRTNYVIDRHSIMHLQLVPKAIRLALHGQMASRWTRADVLGRDPRVAPSVGIEMCSHAAWVLKFQEGAWLYCAETFEIVCIVAVLQCLARLRLGWHQLRVRTGRLKKARARLPRNQRLCLLCSTDGAAFLAQRVGGCCVEDVKHFLLECPAYHRLRARYPCVFGDVVPDGTTQSEQLRLLSILNCDQQDQLAHVVYTMTVFREHCLSLPHGSHVAITNVQQLIVEEDVELARIVQ